MPFNWSMLGLQWWDFVRMWQRINWLEIIFTAITVGIFTQIINRYIWHKFIERHLEKIEAKLARIKNGGNKNENN